MTVVDAASDPFFGRGGRYMALSQRQQSLKFELVGPVVSQERPTACMSFNDHQDHFGQTWGIEQADGSPAHTGCVAFGMDRLAVALFATHGARTADWPAAVRDALAIRDRRTVRWLRLAGSAQHPSYFEIDDEELPSPGLAAPPKPVVSRS